MIETDKIKCEWLILFMKPGRHLAWYLIAFLCLLLCVDWHNTLLYTHFCKHNEGKTCKFSFNSFSETWIQKHTIFIFITYFKLFSWYRNLPNIRHLSTMYNTHDLSWNWILPHPGQNATNLKRYFDQI